MLSGTWKKKREGSTAYDRTQKESDTRTSAMMMAAHDTKTYYPFHRRIFSIAFVLVVSRNVVVVNARTWKDIRTHHDPVPDDFLNKIHRIEVHPSSYYVGLTQSPNTAPAAYPDLERPPPPPIGSPISMPTLQPEVETTEAPVEEDDGGGDDKSFLENAIPLNPPIGYFNYDLHDDNPYGPGVPDFFHDANGHFAVHYRNNGWANVQMPDDDDYWNEFGPNGWGPWKNILTDRNMKENQCGNLAGQSPIDIRLSGVACVEHHQIRTRVSLF